MNKTFYVVEDHSLMRQGIMGFLAEHSDFECIGYSSNARDFFDAMRSQGEFEYRRQRRKRTFLD